jgi:sulfate adenylyltransferase subunit 1 (EFTu-like GTPase family)
MTEARRMNHDGQRPGRAVVVGDVDHGKSTLIGRLLFDTGSLDADRLHDLELSAKDGGPDFSRVMDALAEERRDHITVDTAQTFFSTAVRQYVLIDVPGHREFIRNMVTGATQADMAVGIVDVAQGIGDQTLRHLAILHMIGVRRWIVAVNKMDAVDYAEQAFRRVEEAVCDFAARLGCEVAAMVPVSAVRGDNVAQQSRRMPWYGGPALVEALDAQPLPAPIAGAACLPVQDRYDMDGTPVHVGRILSGVLEPGARVGVQPGGGEAQVAHLVRFPEGVIASASPGENVGVVLEGEAEPARGDVLSDVALSVGDSIAVRLASLSEAPLGTDDGYILRLGHQEVSCRLGPFATRMSFDAAGARTGAQEGDAVFFGDIMVGNIQVEKPVAFLPFLRCPELGRMVVERGGEAVAVGVVEETADVNDRA